MIKLTISKLWPVFATAALLLLAQRLAVEAYWEIHPEARLEAEAKRPAIENALAVLRAKRAAPTTPAEAADAVDHWMAQDNAKHD